MCLFITKAFLNYYIIAQLLLNSWPSCTYLKRQNPVPHHHKVRDLTGLPTKMNRWQLEPIRAKAERDGRSRGLRGGKTLTLTWGHVITIFLTITWNKTTSKKKKKKMYVKGRYLPPTFVLQNETLWFSSWIELGWKLYFPPIKSINAKRTKFVCKMN